uniref:hypothetical protein n=1 Tax=Blastomonas fulva TaxID=1550728 RepID=UPI003F70B054
MTGETESLAADWISAAAALQMMENAGYDTVTAKAVLADQLREGRIKIRADEIWTSDDVKLGNAWGRSPSKSDVMIDTEVPVSVFHRSKRWTKDPKHWKWMENKFYVTIQTKPRLRIIMLEVKFKSDDIKNFAGTPKKIQKPKDKPKDIIWWDWVVDDVTPSFPPAEIRAGRLFCASARLKQ